MTERYVISSAMTNKLVPIQVASERLFSGTVGMQAAFDIALIRQCLSELFELARVLGQDKDPFGPPYCAKEES